MQRSDLPVTPRLVAALLCALVFIPGLSSATGGRIEINHSCALAGCFPTDVPGYPVVIDTPGSYVLTSDLTQTAPDNAIVVVVDGVAIDLAGFEIAGPITCSGSGADLTCDEGGTGAGISAALRDRIQIRNGRVRNFPIGIITRDFASIRDVEVYSCRNGLQVRQFAIVTDSTVHGTASTGIVGVWGLVLSDNITARNRGSGIVVVGNGSVLLRNATYENGLTGLRADTGSVIASNSSLNDAGSSSVSVFAGGLVSGNSVQGAGGSGIRVNGTGSSVQDNAVRQSTDAGIISGFGVNPSLGGNNLSGNGSNIEEIYVDLGDNVCNGVPDCPAPPP